jgi:hypothetical protein
VGPNGRCRPLRWPERHIRERQQNPPPCPCAATRRTRRGGIDYSRIRYIEISQSTAKALTLRQGDFLISRANGSEHLVGRARLVRTFPMECVYPDTIIRYRIGASPLVGEWLELIWESAFIRRQIRRMAKTTAGILKISQDDISQIWLPIPPPSPGSELVLEPCTIGERRIHGAGEDP